MIMMKAEKVVTSFLHSDGKILILKRSKKVKAHQLMWAGISGYLEKNETPINRAIKEITEETGLSKEDIELVKISEPIGIPDHNIDILWIVYPHLFKTSIKEINIDWEHTEYKWIKPETLSNYTIVPALYETLQMILPTNLKKIMSSQEAIDRVKMIKNDEIHGASWLAREAILVLSMVSTEYKPGNVNDYLNRMKSLAIHLMNIRPSMGAINNLVGDILFKLVEKSKTTSNIIEMKTFVSNKIKELNRNSERNIINVSKNAYKLFPDQCNILTHSFSSTVIEAIKFAYKNKKEIQVMVTESRPLFDGRKTANILSKYGIPTTIMTDAAAGFFIGNVDMVLLGADSLLTNGEIINKVGTYPIVLSAAYQGIPVYILADTGKLNLRSYFTQILLEERETKEVWMKPPTNVSVRNLYFDITPKFFITRIITEIQNIKPEELLDISRKMINDRYII